MELFQGKVGLFNTTDLIDKNPGCRATISGLKKVLNISFIHQFPLGFAYHFFENSKSFSIFNKYKADYRAFKSDEGILKIINNLDVVIINAEGTIHDDSVGTRTLISILRLSKECFKKVYIVNGSFFNLKKEFLRYLSLADLIFVREVNSFKYFQQNGITSKLVLDCAFLSSTRKLIKTKKKHQCVFTPGVLFSHGKGKDFSELNNIVKRQFYTIKKSYENPIFLKIEQKENMYVNLWKDMGGDIIDAENISVEDLLSLLNDCELIVSGRYHILLFGMMLNSNIIPLVSNTPKIEGLLKTFDKKSNYVIQDILKEDLKLDEFYHFDLNMSFIEAEIKRQYSNILN